MNLTISNLVAGMTMSSREVAELTGSTHDNVLKTIRRLREEGVVFGNETPYTHQQNGQTYKEFLLSFRDTMVVVSGYSSGLRAKIIDRWQELETRTAKPLIPQTLPEALRLAADLAEQKVALEARVAEQAPKVDALDRIATHSEGSFCIRDAAKTLQIQEINLKQLLIERKWAYRRPMGTGLLAYSTRLQQGVMEHKITSGEKSDGAEWTSTQARITAKGLAAIAEILAERKVVPFAPPRATEAVHAAF